MKAKKNEEAAILACYRRLYKASEPSADFDKLMEEVQVNEEGKKVIDYMSYEIDMATYEEIIKEVIKEFNIKPKHRVQAFKLTMMFGATPKFKKKQTAVEWLEEVLYFLDRKDLFDKAKEMEKDQIIDAVLEYRAIGICTEEEAEQYYNETYGF